MRRAIIRAKESFSAFGVDYSKGDEVPVGQFSTWPGDTLQRRLINGFVEHTSVDVPDPVATGSGAITGEGDEDLSGVVTPAGEEALEEHLAGMSKAELVELAQETYETALSLSSSKTKLISAILELDAAKNSQA